MKADSRTVFFSRHRVGSFGSQNSLEENSLVTKKKAPKSVPRTVDHEPPGLVREQEELEGAA